MLCVRSMFTHDAIEMSSPCVCGIKEENDFGHLLNETEGEKRRVTKWGKSAVIFPTGLN